MKPLTEAASLSPEPVAPSPVESLSQAALAAVAREDWAAAQSLYAQILRQDPDCPEALFYSGYCHVRQDWSACNLFQREAAFENWEQSLRHLAAPACLHRLSYELLESFSQVLLSLYFLPLFSPKTLPLSTLRAVHNHWIDHALAIFIQSLVLILKTDGDPRLRALLRQCQRQLETRLSEQPKGGHSFPPSSKLE